MSPTGLTEYKGHVVNVAKGVEIIHLFPIGETALGVVASVPTEARSLHITDTRAIDIRRFYFDEEQQVWRPTSKGIRIPLAAIEGLTRALFTAQSIGAL